MTTFFRVSYAGYSSAEPYYYDSEEVAFAAADDLCRANGGGTIGVEEYTARSRVSRTDHKPTRYWAVFLDHKKKIVHQRGE